MQFGSLTVVATPIGNLGDMVPRAIEVLQAVDLIAAEDTRHSAKLLQHFAITTPLQAYHEHNETSLTDHLVLQLQQGRNIALISDAGTPLISDPGYRLVKAAHEAGVAVSVVPGACAMVAALSASGLPSDQFFFNGFLPAKAGQRQQQLQSLAAMSCTLVFYESPHRIAASLADMCAVFGDQRKAVLARELSKAFETIRLASLAELRQWVNDDPNQQRGEIVVLVQGAPAATAAVDDGALSLLRLLAAELPPNKAAKIVAKFTGVPRQVLYQQLLDQGSVN